MQSTLKPYKQLIDDLAPTFKSITFAKEFDRLTASIGASDAFSIACEIERLNLPCKRSINVTAYQSDPTTPLIYQGTQHLLCEHSKKLFLDTAERYQGYTIGVYEAVLAQFASINSPLYRIDHSLESREHIKDLVVSTNEHLLAPLVPFFEPKKRHEERLNYTTAIELVLSEKVKVSATTIDLSPSGLFIRIKDTRVGAVLKNRTLVSVRFIGFATDLGKDLVSLHYDVIDVEEVQGSVKAKLRRTQGERRTECDRYVSDFIKNNRANYKMNVDNTVTSIVQKGMEQYYSTNCRSLPVFLGQAATGFDAKFSCTNGLNKSILDDWTDENSQVRLEDVFTESRVETLFELSGTDTPVYLFAFNQVSNEKVYFYSATLDELKQRPSLKQVFLGFGSRKASWRVYRLTAAKFNPTDALNQTSLPDHVTEKQESIPVKRRLEEEQQLLEKTVKSLALIVYMEDITNDSGQNTYQGNIFNRATVRELSVYGHPKVHQPPQLETFYFKSESKRKEPRFKLRTRAQIRFSGEQLLGYTEDLSVSGLKIELDESYGKPFPSLILITLTELAQKSESKFFRNLTYKVVRVNEESNVLNLALSDSTAVALKQSIGDFIEKRQASWVVDGNEESIVGLANTLRTTAARRTPDVCFYMKRLKNEPFIVNVGMASPSHRLRKLITAWGSLPCADLNWIFSRNSKGQRFLVNKLIDMRKEKQVRATAELYVQVDFSKRRFSDGVSILWQHDSDTEQTQAFIRDALMSGEFLGLRVHVEKTSKPDLSLLATELSYVEKHAVHRASELTEMLWDIHGVVFLSDISEEVMLRYKFL